jgi:hypothetical protein
LTQTHHGRIAEHLSDLRQNPSCLCQAATPAMVEATLTNTQLTTPIFTVPLRLAGRAWTRMLD